MEERREVELPDLPESRLYDDFNGVDAYSAEEMREYGRECARMAREQEAFVVALLVAAGHVSREKVAEAREIATAVPYPADSHPRRITTPPAETPSGS